MNDYNEYSIFHQIMIQILNKLNIHEYTYDILNNKFKLNNKTKEQYEIFINFLYEKTINPNVDKNNQIETLKDKIIDIIQ